MTALDNFADRRHAPSRSTRDGYEGQPRSWAEIQQRREALARELEHDRLRRLIRVTT